MGELGVRNFHELGFGAAQQGVEVGVAELLELSFSYQVYLCPVPRRGKPNPVTALAGYQGPLGCLSPEPTHRPSRELLALLGPLGCLSPEPTHHPSRELLALLGLMFILPTLSPAALTALWVSLLAIPLHQPSPEFGSSLTPLLISVCPLPSPFSSLKHPLHSTPRSPHHSPSSLCCCG